MGEKKILFCGGGNMAEGVIRSMLTKKAADSTDITVSELNPQRCGYLKETYGVEALVDASAAMPEADIVFIAVLPKIVPVVAKTLKDTTKKDTLFISIAAGVKLVELEEMLGTDRKIVRVMPNTLNRSGNGHSAVALNQNITAEEKELVTRILNSLGQTMYLPESMFNEFTAYSCSGPLWLYQMADALIDAGVYSGFSRQDARNIVIKNMLGVAMVLDETGAAPKDMVNAMCSPGGVTIEGYKSLIDHGFQAAVMQSVKDAVDKANSL